MIDAIDYQIPKPKPPRRNGPWVVLGLILFFSAFLMLMILIGLGAVRGRLGR